MPEYPSSSIKTKPIPARTRRRSRTQCLTAWSKLSSVGSFASSIGLPSASHGGLVFFPPRVRKRQFVQWARFFSSCGTEDQGSGCACAAVTGSPPRDPCGQTLLAHHDESADAN